MSKNIAHITDKIEQLTSELITAHWEEILEAQAANEKNEISLSCAIKLEAEMNFPLITVKLSFAKKFTDEASLQCEDPNQTKMEFKN